MSEKEWAWKGFLCGNCAVVAANDDWSGVDPQDPRPLKMVPRGLYVIVACCDPQECTFDHEHRPHLEEAEDCDGCGKPGDAHCPAVADDRFGGS